MNKKGTTHRKYSKEEKLKQGLQGIKMPKNQNINLQIQNLFNGGNQTNQLSTQNKINFIIRVLIGSEAIKV